MFWDSIFHSVAQLASQRDSEYPALAQLTLTRTPFWEVGFAAQSNYDELMAVLFKGVLGESGNGHRAQPEGCMRTCVECRSA
eukprot:5200897-Amphidinium_carterae.1